VLAHRGARTIAAENTLEAFEAALAQQADGVELDVHRTADEVLVVHHDADAPGLGVLAELPFEVVHDARPDIPVLADVLDACSGSLVNVEIKNLPGDADYDERERVADLVVALLSDRGGRDDVLVSSFNLATVDRVRTLAADVRTGFLVMVGIDPFAALDLAAERGHGALHPFRSMLADESAAHVVEHAAELGLALNVWTINEPDEIRRLAALGVDAVITDAPDVARRVIDAAAAPRR
jgi:glycerophosphoryl diester phosphodiesterase